MRPLINLSDIQATLAYYVTVTLPDALDTDLFPAEKEAAKDLLREIRLSALQGEATIETHR